MSRALRQVLETNALTRPICPDRQHVPRDNRVFGWRLRRANFRELLYLYGVIATPVGISGIDETYDSLYVKDRTKSIFP